jgi:hypothetical protein
MSDAIIIRRSPADRPREDLANDIAGQVRTRLLGAQPVTVRASTSPPSGSPRVLELGVPGDSTEDVKLTTGGTYAIPHGLRRPILGRLVVWQTAAAHLLDVDPATVGLDPSTFFCVSTTATCTYRILFF